MSADIDNLTAKIKSLEAEISRLQEYEEILNNLPGHVYWKDREGTFKGCNEAQAMTMGEPRQKLKNRTYESFNRNPKTMETLKRVDAKVVNDEVTIKEFEPEYMPDGSVFTYLS